MKPKQRLSASVDANLIAAGAASTRRGEAPTLSAWVNDALRLKVEHDQRLRALEAFVHAYEGEHGEISPEEIERASRRASSRAVIVRSVGKRTDPRSRGRRGKR